MKRILYADDDFLQRVALVRRLKLRGYEVVEAKDGQEAFERIQELEGIDLLITDCHMSKLSGVDLIKRLQQARYKFPVILNSASDIDVSQLDYDGPLVYVKKSIDDPVLEKVQELLSE